MNWQLIWLGTIAIATVVMTATQIVLLLHTARLAKQAADATEDIRREIRPLIAKAHRIADDAGRATSLALAQVERVDRLLTTATARIDDVIGAVHEAIVVPLKQGSAILSMLRAAMALLGQGRKEGRTSHEDEDAMFVG